MRAKTEENVEALASLGVRATMIRLAPSVHGEGDTGLVPQLIGIARKKGLLRMSVTGKIAGRRCIGGMRHGCSDSRWKRGLQGLAITV